MPMSYVFSVLDDLGEGKEAMCQAMSLTYLGKDWLKRGLANKSLQALNGTNQ
jgi:hypothetical protein